jgi:hypothetical protein
MMKLFESKLSFILDIVWLGPTCLRIRQWKTNCSHGLWREELRVYAFQHGDGDSWEPEEEDMELLDSDESENA